MKFSFVADHFSYLSTPCLLLLLCAVLTFFFDGLKSKFTLLSSARYKTMQWVLLSLVVIYMCIQSMLLTENYKDPLTFWNNIIKKNPKVGIAYNNRGNLYYAQGNLDQALLDYNKAIEINPNHGDAYYSRGKAYQDKGNLNQALLDYNKTIELKSDHVIAYDNRGSVYIEKGMFDQALADLNKAIEIKPDDAEAYNNRGIVYYYAKGNYDQAISDYSKAIALNPNLTQGYYNRAAAYYLKHEYDKAWADVHKAEELGYAVDSQFLENLKRASGREK